MKRVLFITCMVLIAGTLKAQTWEEWFQQKKTQIRYLVEQIAAYRVYVGYLEKGYSIAREGLNTINDVKHGDFSLHKGHFDSLLVVNPLIKASARVTDIILLEKRIIEAANSELKNAKETKEFTTEEVAYLTEVYDNIINESAQDIDQLENLTADGNLQMTDDERMKRIETIFLSIQDKYAFVKAFSKQAELLAIQRVKEKSQAGMLKSLYDIK